MLAQLVDFSSSLSTPFLSLQNCGKTLFTNNIAAQPFGAILFEKF